MYTIIIHANNGFQFPFFTQLFTTLNNGMFPNDQNAPLRIHGDEENSIRGLLFQKLIQTLQSTLKSTCGKPRQPQVTSWIFIQTWTFAQMLVSHQLMKYSSGAGAVHLCLRVHVLFLLRTVTENAILVNYKRKVWVEIGQINYMLFTTWVIFSFYFLFLFKNMFVLKNMWDVYVILNKIYNKNFFHIWKILRWANKIIFRIKIKLYFETLIFTKA